MTASHNLNLIMSTHHRTQSQPRSKHFMEFSFSFSPALSHYSFTLTALPAHGGLSKKMEVDMLLNMDGFDDDTPSAFYSDHPWGTVFTDANSAGAFSSGASGSVAVNPTRSNLHSTDQTPSASDPSRSLMSTMPVAHSSEDAPWQMYLSGSLSDSINSLDLDILNPDSLDLVYPQNELANEHFAGLETLEPSGFHGNQTINDVYPIFCTTPLLAPQPRNIQPALLSLLSAHDTENSPLLAQGNNSTEADEYPVYTSSMLDPSAPAFDTFVPQSAPPPALLPPSRGRSPTATKLVTRSSTRPRRGLSGWNTSLTPSSPLLPLASRGRSPTITKLVNHPSTRARRGLSGWQGTNHLEPPAVPSSMRFHRQKPPSGSTSKSSNSGLTVPDSFSPPLSSSTGGSSRNSERLLKRLRQSDESLPIIKRAPKTRRLMVADIDSDDEDVDDGGDSDSDDYTPSRSPSLTYPSRSVSPSSHSGVFKSESGIGSTSTSVKKKTKKGKGKAKGSAALALAVVSQMIRNPSAGRDLTSTRYASGTSRRKNHPIPLPIPVPNLNKKSRGRKVPYIANDTATNRRKSSATTTIKKEEDVEDGGIGFEDQSSSSSTRSRRNPTPEMSKTPSGENRTFVCEIAGCGKCFVRSEHLKRHVRSIHTHDKPHPCPFDGCDKSFSRRDNLGQHVRIHLQS